MKRLYFYPVKWNYLINTTTSFKVSYQVWCRRLSEWQSSGDDEDVVLLFTDSTLRQEKVKSLFWRQLTLTSKKSDLSKERLFLFFFLLWILNSETIQIQSKRNLSFMFWHSSMCQSKMGIQTIHWLNVIKSIKIYYFHCYCLQKPWLCPKSLSHTLNNYYWIIRCGVALV